MRPPGTTIIDRYITAEVVAPFGLGVILLTFALVTGRLLKLTEMVVNHGVTVGDVVSMIGYIMPAFLELTFPMAVLLGVLMGFGRMSGDRELTAARACGISLYRLAIPVVMFSFVVYALSSWLAFSVRPWANSHLREQIFELTQTRSTAGLKEKVFNRNFPGLVVYVDHISPKDETLHGVLISDARDPRQQNTIIARSGMIIPDRSQHSITLRLLDGSQFGTEAEDKASHSAIGPGGSTRASRSGDAEDQARHITRFGTYDLSVHPDEELGMAAQADPEEMSWTQLKAEIAQARSSGKPDRDAETELASKYTLPFTTVLFAILGIPLGLKPARGGQGERFGVAIALFFLYYSLMRAGEALAQRGQLGAFAAMSIPDVGFALLAAWFFIRAATDRGDQGRGAGDFLWDFIERFERRHEAPA